MIQGWNHVKSLTINTVLTCTDLYKASSQFNVAFNEYPPLLGLERGPGGRRRPIISGDGFSGSLDPVESHKIHGHIPRKR